MKKKYLSFLVVIIFVAGQVHGDKCRAYTGNEDEYMSLEYLANYGNVSMTLSKREVTLGVSFCRPKNFSSFSEQCGSGYMIMYEKGCEGVFVFSGNLSRKNKTLFFTLRSTQKLMANVYVDCDENLIDLRVLSATETGNMTYEFRLASMTVCPGYNPSGSDNFLSKGYIIAIVTGIVGVVIVAAALFQWKSKNRSDEDYSQLI
ncbi:hypothetical protein TraAM80_02566 [Trypanosoma rangeli]|uniref:Uncharacterized protein n=1 Tax=Trypanosoma rangeli TaxID=5698 RepID=A0A422NTQ8_TRYRA|nr:uncharacterized protein TraAM80_02566 [Trypanosoma rangeli]RNF08824.1 hypothetical protein TraAM80_02566 [Trypanosoma rangeli]|eukprot:RNF08824.1 hypothetical protein TraAM80_02566 [Trypanosoma rangeli]